MSRHAHTIARVDLRALQPSPDGLLEVLDLLAGVGFEGFSLLYEDSFPWALDDRMRSPVAYPEHIIAGIFEWCVRRELIHAVELTAFGLTDPLLSIGSFHHLRDALCLEEGYLSVARNMIERVIGDVYALLPDSHLIFSPSSIYGTATSPRTARHCLEAVSGEYSDSPASWGLCTEIGPEIRWYEVEPIGDRFDELHLAVASVPSSVGFGGTALGPVSVDGLARLLADRTGRTVPASPEPVEALFNRFAAAEAETQRMLLAVERTLATAVCETGGRRGSALRHAHRAVLSYRESFEKMGRRACELQKGCASRFAEHAVDRFLAERRGPLAERFATALARLETLGEGLVGFGGSPE